MNLSSLIEGLKDYVDLMVHPARRREERAQQERMVEDRYQTFIKLESQKATGGFFHNAVSGRERKH